MLLGVPELARRLGIAESRARVLVASGRIPGQRLGGQWVIDEVDAVNFRKVAAGRPLSERSSWQLIQALQYPARVLDMDLDAVQRHRLFARIERFREAADPVTFVASLLARRAGRVSMSASPNDLGALRDDSRLRLSGVSHPASSLVAGVEIEAYVARQDLPELIRDWFLVPGSGARPNVLIHAVDVLPHEIPPVAVAADLAERPGVREQQSALSILTAIQDHYAVSPP